MARTYNQSVEHSAQTNTVLYCAVLYSTVHACCYPYLSDELADPPALRALCVQTWLAVSDGSVTWSEGGSHAEHRAQRSSHIESWYDP